MIMRRLAANVFARLLLGAGLVVAAANLAGGVRGKIRSAGDASQAGFPVLSWRPGIPPVEDLYRFLEAGRSLVPRGAFVGFASPEGPANAAFYRRLWASYLEPEWNVVDEADARAHKRYLLAYGIRPYRPGEARLLRPLPGGGLYRIGPP